MGKSPLTQHMCALAHIQVAQMNTIRKELFVYLLTYSNSYRGYDCRNNLYYLTNGDVVYHIAALGIVYSAATHKQRYYGNHTDDILCLALHPAKDFVATGQVGRDPPIHVWNAATMEPLSVLKGEHFRGICALDFSGVCVCVCACVRACVRVSPSFLPLPLHASFS